MDDENYSPQYSNNISESFCGDLNIHGPVGRIDHFTVSCLVAWPLKESEAGGDLVLIETSLLSHVNDAVLMLISGNLHMKRSEVSIKTRSTPASLSFKGQGTKHTTVKWSIKRVLDVDVQIRQDKDTTGS